MNSYRSLKNLLLLVILYLSLRSVSLVGGQIPRQHFKLYRGTSCIETNLIEELSDSEYQVEFPVSDGQISVSVYGLWKVRICIADCADKEPSNTLKEYQFFKQGEECTELASGDFEGDFNHVERNGDPELTEPLAYFFSESGHKGSVLKVDSDGYEGNDLAMGIESWFFVGDHEWGIYDEAGFSGMKECLEPDPEVELKGFGFTLGTTSLLVGSVKYGCEGLVTGSIPSSTTSTISSSTTSTVSSSTTSPSSSIPSSTTSTISSSIPSSTTSTISSSIPSSTTSTISSSIPSSTTSPSSSIPSSTTSPSSSIPSSTTSPSSSIPSSTTSPSSSIPSSTTSRTTLRPTTAPSHKSTAIRTTFIVLLSVMLVALLMALLFLGIIVCRRPDAD